MAVMTIVPNTGAKVPPAGAAGAAKVQAQINAAISQPGAVGMRGFLIWVKAAWPKAIADKIIAAAAQHNAKMSNAAASGSIGNFNAYMKAPFGSYDGSTTFGAYMPAAPAAPMRLGRLGRLGALGQTGTTSTVAATSTAPATPSWMSDISSAISAIGQAYLTKAQVSDAQTLFNTNLQRAQAGLSPLPTNPANYGLPSPQVNFGLASGTQSLLIYGGIAAALLAVGYIFVSAKKH